VLSVRSDQISQPAIVSNLLYLAADIVSVALGAFVCKDCGTLHRALDPNISTFVVPSLAIDWNPAAVKFMRDIGNKAHNEFWEKEIPSGITKPTPNSSLYVYF
jgi:hypothetical protein